MSIEKINLRKLLQFFTADARKQRSLLLADIRNDRTKQATEGDDKGGDFYTPFWADAKKHTAGKGDITVLVDDRIKKNKRRSRLYPELRDGFLRIWAEKMRFRNERFEFVPKTIKAQLPIKELGTIVKIENTASVVAWDGSHRIMYPYFYAEPSLTDDIARLGFWALKEAFPDYDMNDLRIIDFIGGSYYRPAEVRMKGDEAAQFIRYYKALIAQRDALKNR